MRIDSNQPYVVNISGPKAPSAVTGAAAASKSASAQQATATRGGDRVVLSAQSREISRLTQALDQLPEVRADQVALAKQRMQNGSDRVDATAVAQKFVDSFKRG
ncbi:flagellar biosynthesis anti-sigma factor FlgM [Geomesophilobacter sediminis]|uniref:Negative regulator of flagellin synthesis n=1 Tax=Geomesophilobacter sediminis TaxID=2798584 RepID=A0A8J7JF36_9BACT|nr:flagellar biosynthesis anti-sigma factor FlgM [Geomesophilobacter sediminis]MBJ6724824.1 flagellar biosynthesis anti-sigma factor FlgM [Geomesophilobacter sediminis]